LELVGYDGKAYKQILNDSAGIVEDVLEGIYRKRAPNLRAIVPLQFLVYFNRIDFDSEKVGQGHLDLTRSIDGLRLTTNNPMIVLVLPELDHSPGKPPSQDPDANACIRELFLEISNQLQCDEEEM
jgi:hypothetical protein